MGTQSIPIEVFYSYADVDEALCHELDRHLRQLQRDGLITTWYRGKSIAGTDWAKTLDQHLNTASIILLLVSSDFVNSDYCYGTEMQRAMERYDLGETLIFPILLRPVDWASAPFRKLRPLPSNGVSITIWRNRDAAFANVAQEIRTALQNIHYLKVSAPAAPLPHIWNIPYSPNPVFTGREEILTDLANALKVGQAAVPPQPLAISGLGGIGKTQVAVEYAYRHRQNYRAVFWVLADTSESLLSGYIAIASLLNLQEKDEQDRTLIVSAVQQWFTTHADWLLILDNADELAIVREFLPPAPSGHILLTTRAQAMGRLAIRIDVSTMDQDIGRLFLLRRAGLLAHDALLRVASPTDISVAGEITEELGGLPLALDQAGAYIEETGCSLADYQNLYHTRRAELLKRRGGLVNDYPESVATTWSLSFEKVKQRSPAASELLYFCAFLHPDAIPEEFLTIGAEHLGSLLQRVARDSLALDEAFSALQAYSLIHRRPFDKILSIHRLVQAVLKDAMDKRIYRLWAKRAILAVSWTFHWNRFPLEDEEMEEEYEQYLPDNVYEQYLPHARTCAELMEQEKLPILTGAHFVRSMDMPDRALPIYEQCDQRLRSAHISQRQKTMHLLEIFEGKGHCYLEQGHISEAIDSFLQCIEIVRQNQYDINRLAHYADRLASASLQLGNLSQAGNLSHVVKFYEERLNLARLSGNLSMYANALHSHGIIYILWGRFEEAQWYLRTALSIRQNLFETGKISEIAIGLTLNAIGLMYLDQGILYEADEYFKRAYEIYKRVRPGHRKAIANIKNCFGKIAMARDQLQEAKNWFEDAQKDSLNVNRGLYIDSLNNQGHLLTLQERWAEAAAIFEETMEIATQSHYNDRRAESLIYLAVTFKKRGLQQRTQQILQEVEQISEGKYFYLLGRAAQLRGDMDYEAGCYEEALHHYLHECEYMLHHNYDKHLIAIHRLTDVLLELPQDKSHSMIKMLNTYCEEHEWTHSFLWEQIQELSSWFIDF
ncbi:hypothetical protein KSF_066810 [Reticulibacter mediterranei]|uniref:TIR domain-containing protein n=1 Tax=Reticulibacter mediterranei TaxID=2778369 RepID=A0A8J3IMC9_9CHLR|nr:tetratricopeptide repeat protein [Reticulibacter mediterranei]GHO96633.1 hypothetical protein KSF_066810 [Reticulibacter mediterranei]